MRPIDFYELSDYTTEARGNIHRIYCHWSNSGYNGKFPDYHLNIDGAGHLWTDMYSLCDKKSHTWRRNTGAIGICLACAYDAWITKEGVVHYGDYPPTNEQLDMLAKVVAKLCVEIGLNVDSAVFTHAEVADIDGYGIDSGDMDMRWDLYGLGDEIRSRAKEYINDWQS